MALYVDSAFLDDIMKVAQTVPLAGVTTNPTILLAARERGQIMDIDSLVKGLVSSLNTPGGLIFMQPGSMDEKEMSQQAMIHWHAIEQALTPGHVFVEHAIHKIPMTHTGMRVAKRLKHQNHRVAFTAVTSVAQAYTAAMVGADFVIPYYNRLERAGVDANERITEMAELFHNQHIPTRILAASVKSPTEAVSALLAGAHDITAGPQVLLDMVSDPQTDEAIEKFARDWQKMNTS
ncbi:MAG: transaldolase family protein [Ktedonobacteraceae bacterium]